jgi:hypothetical protein
MDGVGDDARDLSEHLAAYLGASGTDAVVAPVEVPNPTR